MGNKTMTIGKKLPLVGITLVSLCGVLFWWLQPPSEPAIGSQVLAPTYQSAGSVSVTQLAERVTMVESLLAVETSARRRIEERLREMEERFSVGADSKRAFGLENRSTNTVTLLSPLSSSYAPGLENRHKDRPQVQAAKPPGNLRDALVQIGIASGTVEQILRRIGENRMALLSMREKATREGWADTDEYMAALETFADPSLSLRTEFGDEVYDRYLYTAGKSNRVLVTDTYSNSAAADIGIQPGDLVLRYASVAIFSMRDLKQATVDGVAGESVLIEWQHNGVHLNATVPRGPLGVEMEEVQDVPGGL